MNVNKGTEPNCIITETNKVPGTLSRSIEPN